MKKTESVFELCKNRGKITANRGRSLIDKFKKEMYSKGRIVINIGNNVTGNKLVNN